MDSVVVWFLSIRARRVCVTDYTIFTISYYSLVCWFHVAKVQLLSSKEYRFRQCDVNCFVGAVNVRAKQAVQSWRSPGLVQPLTLSTQPRYCHNSEDEENLITVVANNNSFITNVSFEFINFKIVNYIAIRKLIESQFWWKQIIENVYLRLIFDFIRQRIKNK